MQIKFYGPIAIVGQTPHARYRACKYAQLTVGLSLLVEELLGG